MAETPEKRLGEKASVFSKSLPQRDSIDFGETFLGTLEIAIDVAGVVVGVILNGLFAITVIGDGEHVIILLLPQSGERRFQCVIGRFFGFGGKSFGAGGAFRAGGGWVRVIAANKKRQ